MGNLKEIFEEKTIGGWGWGYTSDDGHLVTGQVFKNGKYIDVDWFYNNYGDLQSRVSREYDVKRSYSGYLKISNPTRNFEEDFIISQNNNAYVNYIIQLNTNVTLTGTDEVSVTLTNTGIPVSTIKQITTMTLLLGVTSQQSNQYVLSGFIPKGHIAKLHVESNKGTATLINSTEILL
jgi:hypothetical protein